jgi:hypothetical protein
MRALARGTNSHFESIPYGRRGAALAQRFVASVAVGD